MKGGIILRKEILKKIIIRIISIATTVFLSGLISTIIVTFMVTHSMNKRIDENAKKEIEELKKEKQEKSDILNGKITEKEQKAKGDNKNVKK